MAQTIRDMVEELPKPETLEEQYLYALVCSVAEVEPKYGISQQAAFKRMAKYWKTFYLVAAAKFTALETPGANSVSNEAIRNNAITNEKVSESAITLDKLADDVTERLWAENRNGTVTEAMLDSGVQGKLIEDGRIGTQQLADGAVTSGKIAVGTITWDNLDSDLKNRISDDGLL